jgi:hypothetical protein
MFIDDAIFTRQGKSYRRVLLRNSYRVNGQVRHDTLANLSHCSDEEIQALKLALNPTSPTRRKNERNLLICRIPAPKGRHYRAVDEPAGGRALWVIFGGGCAGNGSPS